MAENDLSVKAFVVRRVATGESDLVLSLLTRERGKLDVYARAGRKSRKRFQAGLSPCLLYQGMISPPRRGQLWTLEELVVARPASILISRPSRMVVGQYATELVREFCPPEEPERELFDLIDAWFVRLDSPRPPTWTDWFTFEWNVLTAAGLAPELQACVLCRRPPDPGPAAGPCWGFSAAAGGLVCPACGNGRSMTAWNPAWNDVLSHPGAELADGAALLALLEPWLSLVLNKKLFARALCGRIFASTTEW